MVKEASMNKDVLSKILLTINSLRFIIFLRQSANPCDLSVIPPVLHFLERVSMCVRVNTRRNFLFFFRFSSFYFLLYVVYIRQEYYYTSNKKTRKDTTSGVHERKNPFSRLCCMCVWMYMRRGVREYIYMPLCTIRIYPFFWR